jgi:hypothetical protein
MKHIFSASRSNRLTNPQWNKVVRMLGVLFAASAPHHNIEIFMFIELIPVEGNGRFFLTAVPEKARMVRGSAEFEAVGQLFPSDAHGRFRLQTEI